MSGLRSRNKGKQGEREFAAVLTAAGFPAERGRQFSGNSESPDVRMRCDMPVHWEIKRVEKMNHEAALQQCEADAGPMKEAVVAYRRNKMPWTCVLRFDALVRLLKWFFDKGFAAGELAAERRQA